MRLIDRLRAIAQASGLALALTAAMPTTAATNWPGGRWEPGPAIYGVQTATGVKVPMEDGLELDATVSYPTDPVTGLRAAGSFPVLVQYTPYANDQPAVEYVVYGYITANVWPRGTRNSPGVFSRQGPQERRDGVSVVNWASRLQGGTGDVGMFGCSYRGNLALETAALVGRGSPLKAIVAACAGFDAFPREIFMRGGAITRTGAAIVAAGAGYGSALALPFLQALQDDIFAGGPAAFLGPFWADRGTLADARAVVDNDVATLLWSSWSDITIAGALNTYAAMQNAAAGRPDVYAPMDSRVRASPRFQVIVGEGGHGAGLDSAVWLEWFDTFLKRKDTGLDRVVNTLHLRELTRWVNARSWPITASDKVQFIAAPGILSTALPTGSTAVPPLMWDARPEDPNGAISFTSAPYMNGILVAGPVAATVYASSSNTNLQLIVSLYDVAPGGATTLVTDGVLVGSQRALDREKSWVDANTWYGTKEISIRPVVTQANDDYLTPGQPYRFDILLQPRLWPVEPGHSLRLVLTTRPSVNAPCTAALSSTPCFNTAPQLATLPGGVYTVLSDPDHPSSVNLALLPRFYFPTARSDFTSTSPRATIPLDWGPEN